MKKMFFLFTVAILTVTIGCNSDKKTNGETVYVCMGSSATRYHKTEECPSFANCKSGVEAMSVEEAQDMGRTPCLRCYDI